jgi:hypothetical protein
MSGFNAEEIEQTTARLGQVQMSPRGAEQALDRARVMILSRREELQRRHKMGRLIMRIAIPSGIAAAIILATVLSVVLVPGHQATAAEELQQVAQANTAYKGWIHIHATLQAVPGTTLPAPKESLPSDVWDHVNTVDGTQARVNVIGKQRTMDIYLPSRKEVATYDSQTGEVRWATMGADTAKGMTETAAMSPVTLAQTLLQVKKDTGRDPEEVLLKRENGLDRYDITLFKNEEEAKRVYQERGESPWFNKATLWTDPQSRLIQKMRYVNHGMDISSDFTYGKPEIGDIYELGAPKNAKVIDNRLRTDLAGVLDRLAARAVKGLGNCVAVITMSDVEDSSTQPIKGGGFVQLYEKEPTRWFAAHYRIGDANGRVAKGAFLPVAPEGWALPDVGQLVGQLKDIAPSQFWLMDGDKGWAGWARQPSISYDSRVVAAKEHDVMLAQEGLGGAVWPSGGGSSIGSTDSKAELITDPARPGLVGITSERTWKEQGQSIRSESVSWIDPTRDDMPVEKTWRYWVNGSLFTETSTKYLEYAQLPDGQWYPKRWVETRLDNVPRRSTTQLTKSLTQYNLLVVPNMTLDKDWFVNLAEKFGKVK